MSGALARFRVLAWTVGVVLCVLVLVAVPVKYLADEPVLVERVSPVHGALYVLYLVATFDLSRRLRWGLGRTLLVCLGGTVPLVSFAVERRVARDARAAA